MTRRSTKRWRSFAPVAAEIRTSLYLHRLLSTRQINRLHTPGASLRWTRRVLADLADAELVEYVVARRRDAQHLWFLSERGVEVVEAAAGLQLGRRAQVTPEGADGDLQAHTLEVNDVGIAFVSAARRGGDDCGPLSWRHEVSHPIGQRAGTGESEHVRADAMLRYTRYRWGGAEPRVWFVELDRATTPTVELLEKLHRYARYRDYRPENERAPAWRTHYPLGFPEILIVLSGAKPRGSLEQRMKLVCGFARRRSDELRGVAVACALLDDLVDQGPLAPIWRRPDDAAATYLFGADENRGIDGRQAA